MDKTVKPEYYIVPIRNLVIYSILTLGIYQIYWFYRNWRAIEMSEGREIYAYIRAFFAFIFSFFLFQRILKDTELDNRNSSIKALFLWITYILIGFLGSIITWAISKSNIVLPGNTEIILSIILPILLSLSNIIIFIPVQNSINRHSFTNNTIDKTNIILGKTNILPRFVFLTILSIIFIYFLFGTIISTSLLFFFRDSYMGQTDYMKYEDINFSSNIVFLAPLDKSEALDFINKLGYKEEKAGFISVDTDKISEIKLAEDLGNKKIEELNNIRGKDDMRVFNYLYTNKLKSDKTTSDEELSKRKIQVGELDYYSFEIGMALYTGNTKSALNKDSLKKKESIEQYLGDINYIYTVPGNINELDWYPTQNQLYTTIDYVRNYQKKLCDRDSESIKCREVEGSSLILEEIMYDDIFK